MRHTSRDIRTANRYQVLRQAIADSPVSRPGLARETGLSLATVATLAGELVELGMLVEAGFEESGGGRPRGLLAVNPSGGALVGVDVAETYLHVEVFDLALRVLARGHETLGPADGAPERLAQRIAGAVLGAAGRAPGHRVLGVGVTMPGLVDREGGVSFAANWGWRGVPLRELLAERLPHPIYLDNPMRACVVAELWAGAARGREDALVINLGTGVGAGLAFGGRPHRGATNSAGEWGHTTLLPHGRPCRCGRRGCVEAYLGAPGIVHRLRRSGDGRPERGPAGEQAGAGGPGPEHPPPGGEEADRRHEGAGSAAGDGPQEDQTAAIGALARGCAAGEPTAREVVRETGELLGTALADLVTLLDPEVVVLTGWVARRLGTWLLPPARAALGRHALRRPGTGPELVLSPVRTNPVCLGAATFALEGALAAGGRKDA
ncbi:ROK family protein [Streptomyces hoynatensis]|uniref:ROK family protein n=1 Tax=Streptomyces hoynatensis TaxID=1141874 RepID=A0A3A9YJC9_9ACTN|nr:ROK family protein [Streptomyces hoynatensis]RKN35054.1 ROK family protein [Streptomyces hoynatensis]